MTSLHVQSMNFRGSTVRCRYTIDDICSRYLSNISGISKDISTERTCLFYIKFIEQRFIIDKFY